MRRRIGVLLNPMAGRAARSATAAVTALGSRGDLVEVLGGATPEEASLRAHRAVADGLDVLVAAGGDGTVHLALQAVAGTSTPLGIVPLGTGNDAARCVGVPTGDVRAAADVVLGGATKAFDTGVVRGPDAAPRHFLCVLSTGFDSLVNDRANRMRWPTGRLRYVVAMVAELRTFRGIEYRIRVDARDEPVRATIVSLGNGPSYGGGMRVCPHADMHDGRLSMVWMSPMSRAALLRLFPSVYSGRHVRDPRVHETSARVVELDAPGQVAYADGERVGPLPVTVEAAPDSVHVLVPTTR